MRNSRSTDFDDEKPSKSQLKREADLAQKLGRDLLNLSEAEWKKLQLDEVLIDALKECKKIHSNSASKRHFQYIGKLMRDVDIDLIAAYIEKWKHARTANSRSHKKIESLRDDLISRGNPAIADLMAEIPGVDRQKLRQLVTKVNKAKDETTATTAARVLFRYLRDEVLN